MEDRVLYQTYVSHVKLMSRIGLALPGAGSLGLGWGWGGHALRLLRLYLLRPEVLICGLVMVLVLAYLQAAESWGLLGRGSSAGGSIRSLFGSWSLVNGSEAVGVSTLSWELREGDVAAYAVQGRRPKMEDRFVVNDNINDTGVALYAVFDGHGGEVSSLCHIPALRPAMQSHWITHGFLCLSS